jgi:hypothetical protein
VDNLNIHRNVSLLALKTSMWGHEKRIRIPNPDSHLWEAKMVQKMQKDKIEESRVKNWMFKARASWFQEKRALFLLIVYFSAEVFVVKKNRILE